MSIGRRAYDILRGYVGQEWERIKGVEEDAAIKELDTPSKKEKSETSVPVPVEDQQGYARKLLGVGPNANFDEVRKAFERLNKRSDPTNFPEGSEEANQAAAIQKRVHWAFGLLTEGMDATEKRFKSLEI